MPTLRGGKSMSPPPPPPPNFFTLNNLIKFLKRRRILWTTFFSLSVKCPPSGPPFCHYCAILGRSSVILTRHSIEIFYQSLSCVFFSSFRLVVSQNGRALHIVFPHQFLDSPEWFGVSTDEFFQVGYKLFLFF